MSSTYTRSPKLLEHRSSITAAAFSSNAEYLATATVDGGLYIWDVESCNLIRSAAGDTAILCIQWIAGCNIFLCGTESGNVSSCSFSPATESLDILGFLAHSNAVNCLSHVGSLIASGAGKELRVWEWRQNGLWDAVADVAGPDIEVLQRQDVGIMVTALAWTVAKDAGSFLVATYLHHGIRFFERQSWTCVRSISPQGMILSASLSGNCKFLSVLTVGAGFEIYSIDSQTRVRNFEPTGERCPAASCFMEDDQYLVCGSGSGEPSVWNIRTGEKAQTLPHFVHDKVLAVDAARTPTGRSYIVTGVSDELNPYAAIWSKNERSERGVEAPEPAFMISGQSWAAALVLILIFTLFASTPS